MSEMNVPPMNRISKSADDVRGSYDVVVIGSGYGASVAASRMARAGRRVCVLERGREILPGEYPDEIEEAREEFQIDTVDGHFGERRALFDYRVNKDVDVLVGCGLGGTSLINANVSLEMDSRQFEEDDWPAVFKGPDGHHLLDPYYARAREMLGAQPYPENAPVLNKLSALERSADLIGKGHRFYRPPINVTFEAQTNPFGVNQAACTNCGDCCSGCNVSAKNTTLMNYLPDAANHGAEIFTGCSVSHIERVGSRWRVHFEDLERKLLNSRQVDADLVILGAGSLGSTEILMRSGKEGLPLSDQLGEGFSGNGDALGFGYNCYWKDADEAHQEVEASDDAEVDFEAILDLVKDLADGQLDSTAMADEVIEPSAINAVGVGTDLEQIAKQGREPPGPCIAGIIDLRDSYQPRNRLVIEEGVIPSALSSVLAPVFMFGGMLEGDFFRYGMTQGERRLQDAKRIGEQILEDPMSLAGAAYEGPTARTQTYLVMSKDDAAGTLTFEDDRIRVRWQGAGSDSVIKRGNEWMRLTTDAAQGQYLSNPLWSEALGRKIVTVHPLGGARMADTGAEGVVNDRCQVFAGNSEAVHEGLYVCDGAALPASVGVNPLLTITAIAERACELIAESHGWEMDLGLSASRPLREGSQVFVAEHAVKKERKLLDVIFHAADGDTGRELASRLVERVGRAYSKKDARELEEAIEKAGLLGVGESVEEQVNERSDLWAHSLSFSEQMRGFYAPWQAEHDVDEERRLVSSFDLAYRLGQAAESEMIGDFTVEVDDIDDFDQSPNHPGRLGGTVSCLAIDPEPMEIEDGLFELLKADLSRVDTWQMNYQGTLKRRHGSDLIFHGQKVLDEKAGSHWWKDVTTLFVTVADDSGLIGKGILHLSMDALLRQITTVELRPETALGWALKNTREKQYNRMRIAYAARFGKVFALNIFNAYGGLLSNLKNFASEENKAFATNRRSLAAPNPVRYDALDRASGAPQTTGRFALTRYEGGERGPVVLAPGFGVAASSFATPTVERNLVEYLTERGYDVWLLDYRASPQSGHATSTYSLDDIATQDWMQAVDFVLDKSGAPDLQVVAHCVGAMSLLMSLLRGLHGVRSAVCSQLTLHPVTDWMNYLKAEIGVGEILAATDTKVVDIRSSERDEDKAMDAVLYRMPTPPGEECNNPVCHRIFSVFGPSYTHAQLNQETHAALEDMFGEISTSAFGQLSEIIRQGKVVDAAGRDTYLPRVEKLTLPLSFIAGQRNQIFYPETSLRTFRWLQAHNDPAWYDRKLFRGYAHMDMFIGRSADEPGGPFEHIVERLEAHDALLEERGRRHRDGNS